MEQDRYRGFRADRSFKGEVLDPRHFYAAYIFDDPSSRNFDVSSLIDEASNLGYPVRYWWLSDAVEMDEAEVVSSDRLIVCVHHPSADENAGMDLYTALYKNKVTYSELERASLDEYVMHSRRVRDAGDILRPDGIQLFPKPYEPEHVKMRDIDPVVLYTYGDVRSVAQEALGHQLGDDDMLALSEEMREHADKLLTLLVTRLDRNEVIHARDRADTAPVEATASSDYLVYYLLSGLTLTRAASEKLASQEVAAQLQTLVDKAGDEGLSAQEAQSVRLSDLAVSIESVEAIKFDVDVS
jgi:hypothetical protein